MKKMTPAEIAHIEVGLPALLDRAIAENDIESLAWYGQGMADRRGIDIKALAASLRTTEENKMPFPYRHENGNVCCEDPTYPCEACRARLAAEKRHETRTARGRPKPVTGRTHGDGMWRADPRTLTDADRPYTEAERLHFMRELVDAKRRMLNAEAAKPSTPQPRTLAADPYDPPKPYDEALKKLRESESESRRTRTPPKPAARRPRENDFEPPRGYDIALEKMRREK
jgi:hypothetical protein